ncbi:MAG: GIY-YIG nuclease family protein [Acidiferrobacterales bacterium]
MIIYCAFNTRNGKYYVGQTVQSLEKRRGAHLQLRKRGGAFRSALRKYGPRAFVWSILTVCQSHAEMNAAEAYWVRELNSLAPHGYNLIEGGGATGKMTDEARARLRKVFSRPDVKARRSKAQKENQNRPEMVEAHRMVWFGKKRSQEDRRLMSERKLAMKYHWKLDPSTGKRIYWSEA